MHIEVMLMDDVKKLGKAGELVKVAPGYARNFLFPKGLAEVATEAAKRRLIFEELLTLQLGMALRRAAGAHSSSGMRIRVCAGSLASRRSTRGRWKNMHSRRSTLRRP